MVMLNDTACISPNILMFISEGLAVQHQPWMLAKLLIGHVNL